VAGRLAPAAPGPKAKLALASDTVAKNVGHDRCKPMLDCALIAARQTEGAGLSVQEWGRRIP
jgi:hypothetical protein